MVESKEKAKEVTDSGNTPKEEVKAGQDEPEMNPQKEETFGSPVLEELKFKKEWTLWEHYEMEGAVGYADSMCKTCWFNDLVSFATAWSSIPHRDLTNFFFNEKTKKIKKVEVKGQQVRVNGVSLFQTRIQPEWEDIVNKNGGEFRIDFKSNLPFIQKLWEKLVLSIISNEFENAEMLSGVRILDKSTSDKESMFRIEVWTMFNSQQEADVSALKKHLEEEYVRMMIEDADTKPLFAKIDPNNPSEWIKKFSDHSH